MPKTIVLICLCFLKCIAIVSSQSKTTLPIVEKNWSVDLRDGWNAALFLHPDHKGTKIGTFFWLFDKQPITWNLKEGILTIQFKDAWREFSDDSAILKFKHTPDGLKLLTEGMSKNEKQLLEGTIFKSGGKSPQQLADFRNRKSPYSKFHVKASLTINPNIIPLGLAETALKIHQQNKFEIGIISSHRKMPLEILRGLMNTASKTKSIGRRKLISPWQGSSTIMYYMSIHPNLERKDLEVCWNLPFSYSGGM